MLDVKGRPAVSDAPLRGTAFRWGVDGPFGRIHCPTSETRIGMIRNPKPKISADRHLFPGRRCAISHCQLGPAVPPRVMEERTQMKGL